MLAALGLAGAFAAAQVAMGQADESGSLPLDKFRPKSMLRVDEHPLVRAKFPVVDVHVHPRIRLRQSPELLDAYVKLMDAQNIAVSVSLDGQMGESFVEHRTYLWTKYKAAVGDLRQYRLARRGRSQAAGHLGLPARGLRNPHGRPNWPRRKTRGPAA